ncbi:MAG: polysaccharide biosynthesis C-terminal domain-containing protein [Bacteroidales bacterium]|nr:polysaccharide biosynthesis C-terminal domain-containing protein [Bacteroidales bacterium]
MLADFRKLFRLSAIYGLGTLSTKLAGFVLIPLYTRSFSVAQFGVLGLLEVSAVVIISFFGFSLYSGFFRWYWDKSAEDKKESLFFTVTIFQIGVVILAYFAMLPFLKGFSQLILDTPDYAYLLRLMLISALMQTVLLMPNTLLRLQEKPWLFTLANSLQLVFSLSVTIYFIVYRHSGIDGIYYGQIAGSLAFASVLIRYSVRNMVFKFETAMLRDILIYCLPLFFSGVALVFLNVTDRYSLKVLGNMADVGLYSYGYKLANTLNVFLITSVNFAIQPMIYRMMNDPDNKKFYARLLTYYTYGTMLVALAMMVFGMEITKLFARRVEYFDAWYIFPFIIYSIVFGMMKDVVTTGLSISKKTKVIAFTVIVTAVLNLVLNVVLIRLWGNQGAALSKMLSMLIFFALTLYYAQRNYPISYEMKRIAIMLIIAAGLYGISVVFNSWDLIPRLLAKSIVILSYPFVLYLFGFYHPAELSTLRSGWDKWRNPGEFKQNILRLIKK